MHRPLSAPPPMRQGPKSLNPARAEKRPGDQLFDGFDATDLNKRLKELMDGLSAKVRRV